MKLILGFSLVLFVALCCAQGNAEDDESFSCTPNELFKKDCNGCKCGPTGTYATCNTMTCDPENKSNRLKAPENCTVEDKWTDGCNACFCTNGVFTCTKKICSTLLGKRPEVVVPQEPIV